METLVSLYFLDCFFYSFWFCTIFESSDIQLTTVALFFKITHEKNNGGAHFGMQSKENLSMSFNEC